VLELVGEVLGDPGHVLAELAVAGGVERWTHDAAVPVALEEAGGGTSGAPVRRASVAGPAGSVVRSPKNSTSTPPPAMSRSHTSEMSRPSAMAFSTLGPGVGAERHDLHAERSRRS
jgi:hypothetical protein